MSSEVKTANYWIKNPEVDSIFFSFGWILIFLALVMFKQYQGIIIVLVLLFNYVHRHLTFALVYGEKEEFNRKKEIYIVLPLLAVFVTYLSLVFGFFKILLTISVLWTMYHTVTQKYGITRIYSRKAGYGEGWIDKGIIYSWFVFLFFALANKEKETIIQYQAGQVILNAIGDNISYLIYPAYVSFFVAIIFTLIYAYSEYKNRDKISIAKNLYVVSVLLLYSTFFYSLIAGYIVFGFSHAIEYIAFVNIFVKSKYKKKTSDSVLAKASKKLWLYSSLFALVVVVLSLTGLKYNQNALLIYIVGSSFLHFIYDGMIWKVRRPEVGKPLEIKYKPT